MSARASYFGLCQNGSTYHSALLCVPLSELKPYSKTPTDSPPEGHKFSWAYVDIYTAFCAVFCQSG